MKFSQLFIAILFFITASYSFSQTGKYTTYSEAMKDAKGFERNGDHRSAHAAFESAVRLAKTETYAALALFGSNDAAKRLKSRGSKNKTSSTRGYVYHKEIVKNYEKIISFATVQPAMKIRAHMGIANVYEKRGQKMGAGSHYKQILKFGKYLSDAERTKSYRYLAKNGNGHVEQIKYYDLLLQRPEFSGEERANLYIEAGKLKATYGRVRVGISTLEKALAIENLAPMTYAKTYKTLAEVSMNRLPNKASAYTIDILAVEGLEMSERLEIVAKLTEMIFKRKRYGAADELFKSIQNRSSNHKRWKEFAILGQGHVQFAFKNYPAARTFYKQLPNNYNARFRIIGSFHSEKNYKEAAAETVSMIGFLNAAHASVKLPKQKQHWRNLGVNFLKNAWAVSNEYAKIPKAKPHALKILKALQKMYPVDSSAWKSVTALISKLEVGAK